MIIYRIRRKDGLYSKGGMEPYFGPKGKIWTSKGALSNHFAQFNQASLKKYYGDCQIIEYELAETELITVDIPEYLEAVAARREKRNAAWNLRLAKEEAERAQKRLEAALKVVREAGIKV